MAGAGRLDDGGGRGQVTTVFVSDPTAEAERVAQALRIGGYAVVDVPLSMLVARVAVQTPRVILIDADSDGALDAVGRMRELPDADDIHVLFLARPGGAVASPEEALAHEGSGLFVRPVDVPALVRKVEVLAGGPRVPATPSYGSRDAYEASLPPASMRSIPVSPATPVPPPTVARASMRSPSEPPGPPSGLGSGSPPKRTPGLAPPVSSELQQLLAEAEMRVQVRAETESMLPSPEDEIEAVLPAELLASLDEPMEADDDEDEAPAAPRSTQAPPRERTNDGGAPRTTGASSTSGGTGGGPTPAASKRRPLTEDAPAPPPTHGNPGAHTSAGTHTGPTGGGISTTGGGSEPRVRAEPARGPPPEALQLRPARVPADLAVPTVMPSALEQGESMDAVARAIAARTGGSLCFVEASIERRVVLREGDIVTAASSADEESLLAFLGARGDLPRETVRRLGSKFPPFGRHAVAALVARGYLGQDHMWPTLRAHAEWVLSHVLQMREGRLVVEERAPGRLASEPSVFGGSTGAEVFVELVRRIVAPSDAIERVGGLGARLGHGASAALLAECALAPEELERLRASTGRSLREVLDGADDGDLATVVFALARLDVLEVLPSVNDRPRPSDAPADAADDAAIDAEAIRERVRARAQIVDDGDYFAVLGVSRDATGYEVRRAFLELRRAFDPSRMLTPEVADLAGDVRKITTVLEEAYEILKDNARRDRYRRAIEAGPEEL